MQDMIENLKQIYGIQGDEQHNDYLNKAIALTTTGKRPDKYKTLIIVGGQPGAGKSRLIAPACNELGNNAAIVDFDELRAQHPSYIDVSDSYPEITYKILQRDVDIIKDKLVVYLINNEYNVIYEGGLRNIVGFQALAQKFKDRNYKINLKVMAVPELESYGSTLLRYAYSMITDRIPRWVEKSAHDDAYVSMLKTIKTLEENALVDDIDVYMRSSNNPKKIFSTGERQFKDATAAILYGRETDRKKAVENFPEKYKFVKETFEQRKPELVETLGAWKDLYEREVEYLKKLKQIPEK